MAKRTVKAGITSRIEYVWIQNSAATDGSGKTGLAWNTAGWKAYYIRPGASPVAITLATQTINGSYSSGGFVEADATNMAGLYRLDVPDAVFAAGVDHAVVSLYGPTGAAPVVLEYDLVAYDPQDTARLGLTSLPSVAAGANGGLPLGDASGRVDVGKWLGTAAATPSTAGVPAVDVVRVNNTAQTAGDLAALSTTISNKLGAWTGTGINTVLGALRALANKASSLTPTDLSTGGTFDNTTDSLEAQSDGAAFTSTVRNAFADSLLDRVLSAGANAATDTARSVRNALRALVNKVAISGSTMTVYQEDDSTTARTASVTGTSGADPITTIDPT